MNQQYIFIGGIVLVTLLLGILFGYMIRQRHTKATVKTSNVLASSLQDEKLKSDIILGAIDDGVVLIDDHSVIRLYNQGASDITGWKREEAEGLDWRSVFRFLSSKGENVSDDDTPFMRASKNQEITRDNTSSITGKDGKTIAVNFTVSPLMNSGKITGLVAVFRDVSEERREENQRAEFISTASHEMRTPVAAIEGYLSLALNDRVATVDSRARDYLEKAHSSTQHLGRLFQDLLTSAKAEDGRLVSHPRIVELGEFIEKIAEDLRFAAEKKNLFMEFTFGNNIITNTKSESGLKIVRPLYFAKVDPDRIREVITNLFDNACKYTEQGKVTLGITGNDSVVQIFIRDTGAGIPAEDIPHLFQKFYRVDNSSTRTIGGTGLGLFISRKIVEFYQGRIWVESKLGKGSTFYINFPRIDTVTAQEAQSKETPAPTEEA